MVIQCETFFTFIRHYFIFSTKLPPGLPFRLTFTISQFINDHSFAFQNIPDSMLAVSTNRDDVTNQKIRDMYTCMHFFGVSFYVVRYIIFSLGKIHRNEKRFRTEIYNGRCWHNLSIRGSHGIPCTIVQRYIPVIRVCCNAKSLIKTTY